MELRQICSETKAAQPKGIKHVLPHTQFWLDNQKIDHVSEDLHGVPQVSLCLSKLI